MRRVPVDRGSRVAGRLILKQLGDGMYSDLALKHVAEPQNMGRPEDTNGIGQITSPYCHDTLTIFLNVQDGVIDEAGFGFEMIGCGASIASASYAMSLILGKTLAQASRLSGRTLVKKLRLPASREHCAVLVQDAVRAAIEDYRKHIKD